MSLDLGIFYLCSCETSPPYIQHSDSLSESLGLWSTCCNAAYTLYDTQYHPERLSSQHHFNLGCSV